MTRHHLGTPKLVVESQEVCIVLLFMENLSGEPSWPWWWLRRFRFERDLILCGLLNGDVDIFVVLNFRNKSCVSCAPRALLFIAYHCLPLYRVLDLGLLMIYYSSLYSIYWSTPSCSNYLYLLVVDLPCIRIKFRWPIYFSAPRYI
jgi:hypothetical protein